MWRDRPNQKHQKHGSYGSANEDRGDYGSANVGRGDYGSANVGRGDYGSANVGRGNYGSANVGRGNYGSANESRRNHGPPSVTGQAFDAEFGFSIAEMSKLKGSNQQRKHLTFDNDQGEDGPSDSAPSDHADSDGTMSDNAESDSDGAISESADSDGAMSDSAPSESESNEESDSENNESSAAENYDNMTMAELLSLQEEIGTKAFKKKVLKVPESDKRPSNQGRLLNKEQSYKRLNKNRPSEMPLMRKRAPRKNFLEPGKKAVKKISRDPRFDDLSGDLNMRLWDERYQFLKDSRKREMEVLKKRLKKEHRADEKKKIHLILQRMRNQQHEGLKRNQEFELKRLDQQQQREALRQGRKPRFMSIKEKKMILKTKQFEQLKKDNKLDKYMERKEKKQLKRDRKAAV